MEMEGASRNNIQKENIQQRKTKIQLRLWLTAFLSKCIFYVSKDQIKKVKAHIKCTSIQHDRTLLH